MNLLAEKFTRLKTHIGGNREQMQYEDTFGMPKEAQAHITVPSAANTRIISELEFAINLSRVKQGAFDAVLDQALDYLLVCQQENGALTNQNCEEAERMLQPLEAEAKTYQLILAAHAHIDMNWMWSYNETVAIVLATFRTILHIMDQYPSFCFSQSQASVYRIVEEYDPQLMEEIKTRIAQGRWEVTATAWVETDKNMPNTESLLRHIQYTREYLTEKWGVQHFDIDFSPDTFGHSVNVPEINSFGDVKYYYHCRGLAEDHVLYRWQAPSGKEILTYREPNWYNGAITPHIGAGIVDLSERCAGLKTGLVIYGVGDHGGGPTRRDVERALEMMTWKIYPQIRFGTIREFFLEAEKVRAQLPVVNHELNFFAPGCYTTQSRIKRGNRRLEAALLDADALSAVADGMVGFPYAKKQLRQAWQNVMFTHFHDILTGSCVQDSREHAMGLYQASMAAAATQTQNALRVIASQIDTSSIPVDIDAYNSQSEGAGAGYGIENFIGVPSTERGSGKTRIFHVFNPLELPRTEVVELTVWDWIGDMREIEVVDFQGNPVPFQLVDKQLQQYWDHKNFRILVDVTVPPMGYTTIVLREQSVVRYRCYFQDGERTSRFYDDIEMQNDQLRVVVSAKTGRICSLRRMNDDRELIAAEQTAGLEYIETEAITSSAWQIGRYLHNLPVDRCTEMKLTADGALRKQLKAKFTVAGSTAEITYTLDQHSPVVRIDIKVDWHEIGQETIPVLCYRMPLAYTTQRYLYDVPGGAIYRKALTNDVPALQYGLAENPKGDSAILISDSKYGYRGAEDALSVTLLNSSVSPDPYPERGIHQISLFAGAIAPDAGTAEKLAQRCTHALCYQPSNCHAGTLPMENSLFRVDSDTAVLSAVTEAEEGGLILRFYETAGQIDNVCVRFGKAPSAAQAVDLAEQETAQPVTVHGNDVRFAVQPNSLFAVHVRFAKD